MMEQKCLDNGISEFGCSLISGGLYFGYFLFLVAVVALIILPAMNALKAPKELVKSGGAIGALVLIFIVAYALSGDEVTLKTAAMGTTPESSKMIGAGLIMLYVVFFVAMGGLIYSFVSKSMK
jgi:hypothetical protein